MTRPILRVGVRGVTATVVIPESLPDATVQEWRQKRAARSWNTPADEQRQ
jgi:hypothetical protein